MEITDSKEQPLKQEAAAFLKQACEHESEIQTKYLLTNKIIKNREWASFKDSGNLRAAFQTTNAYSFWSC